MCRFIRWSHVSSMLARAPRTETPRAFCPSAEQAPGCADNVPDGDSDCDVILTEPIHAQDELCWGTGYMRFAVGAPSVLLVFLLCLALAPPHVWAIAACGLCVLLEVGYVLDSRAEWEEHHMTRVQRDHPASPSHHERPPLRRQSEHAAHVVKLAKLSKQANSAASACDEDEGPQQGRRKRSSLSSFLLKKFRLSLITETIAALGAKQSTPIVGRDRHQLRRLSSSPFRESFLLDSDEDSTDRMATTQPQSTVVSPSLDMNHVPLSWNDYLWVAHVVAIPQIMFFIFGMAKMMVIDLLRRCGLPRCATDTPSCRCCSFDNRRLHVVCECRVNGPGRAIHLLVEPDRGVSVVDIDHVLHEREVVDECAPDERHATLHGLVPRRHGQACSQPRVVDLLKHCVINRMQHSAEK